MAYKILYLTYHPNIGGGETILLSTLTKLNPRVFKPIVVIPQKGQLYKKFQDLKINAHVLPINGYLIRTLFIPGMSPKDIYNFYKLTKEIKPNLIHINHLNLTVYAGVAAKLLNIPVVATAHGPWDSLYFYQDIITNLFTNKILANTQELKNQMIKRGIIAPKQIDVINFGVDTLKFKPANKQLAKKRFGFSPSDFIITIVGRLDPTKDHLTFLEAADIIQKNLENVRFFIVGSRLGDYSSQENYHAQIKNYLKQHPQLAKKITFGGFIEDMPPVYQATDVLVSTSVSESFGLALAEAAACGLPIVTTAKSQIVKNNRNGFIIAPKKPKLLAQKVLELLKNPQLRKEFGETGRKHITGHFQLQDYVASVEGIYLSLLTNQLKSKRS